MKKVTPCVWFNSFETIDRSYGNQVKRKNTETFSIHKLKPSLNKRDK